MSQSEREACADLNRQRASAIKETARINASSRPIPRDVWAATFARRSQLYDVPLISLEGMSFFEDDEETMWSKDLANIGLGREATAWSDEGDGTVYKLFDLKIDHQLSASMGLKLLIQGQPPDEVEVVELPATIDDILDKICVLHAAGACPQKSPACQMMENI